ncbi:MAG: hypothetical protein R3C26_19055 [Calditrichia bacterium]
MNVIVGVDLSPNDTGNRRHQRRNEGSDEVTELGAYAQSLFKLGSKLDLTLAARGDYNNIFEKWNSPRVLRWFSN